MALHLRTLERDEWTALSSDADGHSYRQSWAFGDATAARVGAESERIVIEADGRPVGLAHVRVKRLPVIGGGIAYVTGGPATIAPADPQSYVELVHALDQEYTERRGLVLRIIAPVGPPEWNEAVGPLLTDAGFTPTDAAKSYRTFLLDITRPLDEIRRTFKQKWRNCLNRSDREGLEISSHTDVESFDRFVEIFEPFRERKGFTDDLEVGFYRDAHRDASDAERFTVLLAEKDGELVAGHVSSPLGATSVYLLGASTESGLKARASYALQWHAIRTAQEHGCRWYDLGGINPETNPGVHHFKRGLGGIDVSAVGPLQSARGARSKLVLKAERAYRARS